MDYWARCVESSLILNKRNYHGPKILIHSVESAKDREKLGKVDQKVTSLKVEHLTPHNTHSRNSAEI